MMSSIDMMDAVTSLPDAGSRGRTGAGRAGVLEPHRSSAAWAAAVVGESGEPGWSSPDCAHASSSSAAVARGSVLSRVVRPALSAACTAAARRDRPMPSLQLVEPAAPAPDRIVPERNVRALAS